ncbi:hypothetical protein P6F26_10320 [Roseibacterium sp. SDUM158017]|uniref:hypothetical protein n=1 Tax=Roseicyclus salinarum TaxID=3036773 RepID=UPI00241506D1|nr:hypothetical protein [Roseibacterium sp. SDUM158017]MDG4648838.1 hypothetical protein [Roseibacterium sp. SDUM158017]
MQWSEIRENWTALIPSVQARWPQLSEERLTALNGERDELVATLVQSGTDAQEAEREVEDWRETPLPADAYADPAHDAAAAQDAGGYVPEGEDPLSDDRRFGDDSIPETPIGRRES